MNEKIKLPVTADWIEDTRDKISGGRFRLLGADGKTVDLEEAADAINATARRCDGCAMWTPQETVRSVGHCEYFDDVRVDDDCCRHGWEAR